MRRVTSFRIQGGKGLKGNRQRHSTANVGVAKKQQPLLETKKEKQRAFLTRRGGRLERVGRPREPLSSYVVPIKEGGRAENHQTPRPKKKGKTPTRPLRKKKNWA